jgi:hypothetical protein
MKQTKAPWEVDPDTAFTLKNEWDFRGFEILDESRDDFTFDILNNLNLGIGCADENKYPVETTHLRFMDGCERRAVLEHPTLKMYLLPDPPNSTFDRRHIYRTPGGHRVPRDLWEIMFYNIKPFVDEEVCNAVKNNTLEHNNYNVLLREFDLIHWAVLHLYTETWRPRLLTRAEKIEWSRTMRECLISLMKPIYKRKGDFLQLDECDWSHIMMCFGDSFMQLFGSDLIDQCFNCKITRAAFGSNFRRCGGCRNRRYCGKTCQKEDWQNGHNHECSWKEKQRNKEFVAQCFNCNITASECMSSFGRCSGCNLRMYCGERCQKEDWKKGHKHDCSWKNKKQL